MVNNVVSADLGIEVNFDSEFERLEARAEGFVLGGIRVPVSHVSEVLDDMEACNEYVLMAHGKAGKTSYTLSEIALPLAAAGRRVGFASLEIGGGELADYRLVSILLRKSRPRDGWPLEDIRRAREILQSDYRDFKAYVTPKGAENRKKLLTLYKEAWRRDGIELGVLDNFHYTTRVTGTKRNEEGDLSQRIKDELAVDLHIPVLVLAHPRKEARYEGEPVEVPPSAHDLRGESAVANDATQIVCLHRPLIPNPENPSLTIRSPLTQWYSTYRRNGAEGASVNLVFEGGNFKWHRASAQEVLDLTPSTGRGGTRYQGTRELAMDEVRRQWRANVGAQTNGKSAAAGEKCWGATRETEDEWAAAARLLRNDNGRK